MGKLALNRDYAKWLTTLKQKIRKNQIKAAIRVNETLLRLYWEMGREINERQKKSKWGSGFLVQLSRDLLAEFPDMKGFSLSNLKYNAGSVFSSRKTLLVSSSLVLPSRKAANSSSFMYSLFPIFFNII